MTKMIKNTATSDVESDADYSQEPVSKGGLRGWRQKNKVKFMIFVGLIVIVLAVAVVTPIVALKKDGKPWTLDNHEKALKEEMPSFGSDNSTSRIGTLPTGSIIRTATSDDDSSDATTAFSRTSITAEIVPTDTESSASSVETTLSEPVATATD